MDQKKLRIWTIFTQCTHRTGENDKNNIKQKVIFAVI